jgi:hypothetical protein
VIARPDVRQLPLIVALALALVLVPVALAGKGGGGKPGGGGSGGTNSTSALTGPTMVYDANSNGAPNWGDEITFTTSVSWTLYPSVEVDCAQNGTAIYKQIVGFYPTYIGDPYFTLKGYWWTGGAASCTATLFYTGKNGSRVTLGTTSFPVGA